MHERIPPLGGALRAALLAGLLGATMAAPASAAGCDAVDTPARLAATLTPGQVGCVHAGTYTGQVKVTRPGITITSYPGERAKIFGRLWIAAADVTVSGIDLDARQTGNQASVLILADRAKVLDADVTNGNTAICFNVGAATWTPLVVAHDVVISGNRIHDCGRLPAGNHDHGIYVENAVGTQILGNAIFDNADRAINLYPNADDSLIRGNVMDGNGEGVLFSGDLGMSSDGNVVENNVITNPKLREAIESWFPAGNPVGTGNVVRNNCIHGGAGTVDSSGGGFTVGSGNLFLDPLYASRAIKDFALPPQSPCKALLSLTAVVAPPVVETPPVVVETPPVVTPPVVVTPPAVVQPPPAQPAPAAPAPADPAPAVTMPAPSTSTTPAAAPKPTSTVKPTAKAKAKARAKKLAARACAAARRTAGHGRAAAARACSRAVRRVRALR